jgi:predicted MFS family arabinose efflux permease
LLSRTAVICALTNFLFQVVTLDMIVMAGQDEVSPALVGVLLAASGVGGLLGASFAPRLLARLEQPGKAVYACVAAWCVALWIFALAHHPMGWLVAWAAVGFTGSQMSVLRGSHQATVVRPEWMGLVGGFNQFLTQGAVLPLAHIFGGGAIETLGPTTIAVVTAVVVSALLVLLRIRGWHTLLWSDERLHKPGQAPLCPESSDVNISECPRSGSALSLPSSLERVPS